MERGSRINQFGRSSLVNPDYIYRRLEIGEVGSLTYQGQTEDVDRWERFARKVRRVDEMEAEGLVQITFRHRERQSGFNHVDVVRFKRLR